MNTLHLLPRRRARFRVLPVLGMALLCALCLSRFAAPGRADMVVQNGQKVAFLGDSITAYGWMLPTGYVQLIIKGLAVNGVTITPIPAGVGGNTSKDMLARLDRDVLSKKPDWMTLSCGVNDVWHGANGGVPLDQYETNITSIVDQAQAAGIKVLLLTSTPITEDQTFENNKQLVAYNDFLRGLAKDKNCALADLNADAQTAIAAGPRPGRILTVDGVHMNGVGNDVMATGVLRAMGLNEAQLQKARATWLDIPNGTATQLSYNESGGKTLSANVSLTLRDFEALQAVAFKRNKSAIELLNVLYAAQVRSLLLPSGTYESVDAIYDAKQDKAVQTQLQAKMQQAVSDLLKTAPH